MHEEDTKTILDKYQLNVKAKAIHNQCYSDNNEAKKISGKGKESKEKIITKLFYETSTFLPNSNFFYVIIAIIQVNI